MGGFSGALLAGRHDGAGHAFDLARMAARMLGALTGADVAVATPTGAALISTGSGSGAGERADTDPTRAARHVRVLFDGRLDNRIALIDELAPGIRSRRDLVDCDLLRMAYAKWGVETPKRLSGPFAFAIHDENAGTMFCARDRLGQKSLWHARRTDGFFFATHVAALLAWPGMRRRADLDVLAHHLTFGFALSGASVLESLEALRPGHRLMVDRSGACRIEDYWRLKAMAADTDATPDGLADEFEQRLRDVAGRQCVAPRAIQLVQADDLPSAELAGALAQRRPPSPALSVRLAAAHGDRRPGDHELLLTDRDIVPAFESLTIAAGTPLVGLSAFIAAAASRGAGAGVRQIAASLAGQEALLDHDRYARFDGAAASWRRATPALRSAPFARDLYHHLAGLITESERARLTGPGMAHTLTFSPIDALGPALEAAGDDDAMDAAARSDIANLPASAFAGPAAGLCGTQVDLALPFADHEFADWCASLPQRSRSALRDELARRRGRSHATPAAPSRPGDPQILADEIAALDAWLRTGLAEFMRDTFASSAFRSRGLFSQGVVEGLVRSHLAAKRHHGRLLWTLLCIETWFASVVETASRPAARMPAMPLVLMEAS